MIAAGLAWRRPELGLPAVLAKYGGSVLWGAMVFCLVGTLLPRASPWMIGLVAAVVSAAVELSQAVHVGWLDAFRATTFGQLLLGQTFVWADIAAYWFGVTGAVLVATLWARWRR